MTEDDDCSFSVLLGETFSRGPSTTELHRHFDDELHSALGERAMWKVVRARTMPQASFRWEHEAWREELGIKFYVIPNLNVQNDQIFVTVFLVRALTQEYLSRDEFVGQVTETETLAQDVARKIEKLLDNEPDVAGCQTE